MNKGVITLWCAVGLLFLWGCGGTDYRSTAGGVYGTIYHVTYESGQDYDMEIRREMERVNQSLSMFNPQSVIARWNRGETEEVDSLFLKMWAKAVDVHAESGGAFDVTVAPLVNAWGFGTEGKQMPTREEVDSLLAVVGMDKVTREGDKLRKAVPGVQMDASSIAKGLGVDLVAEFFDRRGVENYMIEIGGEVRVRGVSGKNRPWRIGIDKPVDDSTAVRRQLQTILELTDGALATSGNYRRYYVVDGKKYAHTIDPKTGLPVQRDIVGASVYAPTCMEADAYATAFMVLGMEKSRRIVEKLPSVEACLIYLNADGKMEVWMSDGIRELVLEE